ncbi:phospholipase D-like domain-containing protein [Caldiplasma sukawensis]
MEVYSLPEAGKTKVIDFIKSSYEFLNMNFYLLDDEEVMRTIKEQVEKKVKVRIIIDGHPFNSETPDISVLKNTGAKVIIAPMRFDNHDVFDHAKYMVNEHSFFIGTLNMTESAFTKNREYFVIGDEKKIRKALENVFESDYENERIRPKDRDVLMISPDSERELFSFMRGGKKLFIETEELGDDPTLLELLRSKGKKVRLILPSTISSEDKKNALSLKDSGVKIRIMPANSLYLHAKMIHIKKRAFIGSQNFSGTSLERNREIGIIFKKGLHRKILMEKFNSDWKISENLKN